MFLERLRKYNADCDAVLTVVEGAMDLLDRMASEHTSVCTKTSSLHDTCERLLGEQKELEAREKHLSYFSDLEKISKRLGFIAKINPGNVEFLRDVQHGSVDPTSTDFSSAVARVDECIEYLGEQVGLS